MNKTIFYLFLINTFLLSNIAYARDTSIKLFYFKGKVQIKDTLGHKIAPKRNVNIPKGSTITVGKKSLAIINIGNSSKLKINSNSRIQITDVLGALSKKGKVSSSSKVSLLVGSVFAKVISKTRKKPNFYLTTKTVALGVRGTEFFSAYGKEQVKGKKDFWMCVNEGQVEVHTLGNKEKTIVKEGEGVFIHKGEEYNKPKAYAWTKKLNWNLDPNEGKLENKISIDSAYADLLDQVYD